jgi:hypothetical protein
MVILEHFGIQYFVFLVPQPQAHSITVVVHIVNTCLNLVFVRRGFCEAVGGGFIWEICSITKGKKKGPSSLELHFIGNKGSLGQ